jgi:hypothetical protein
VADWDTRPPQTPWSSGDQGRPIWTTKEQPGPAPAASAPARGWGSSADQATPPSWFDRLNQPIADPATTEPAPANQATAEPAKTESPKADAFKAFAAKTSTPDDDSSTATPSAAAASDVDTDDDDWPTRYSWLEDDEADEATPKADNQPDAAETVAAKTVSPDTVPAKTVTADDAIVSADSGAESAETAAVAAPVEDEDTGTDEPPAPQASGAKLVTVIPGVPRYHDPDCILIRFMGEADVARKSIPEAQAANCTPCAACQPEG